MKASSTPHFLTPPEIARRYGISVDKVLAWIRTGELRALNLAESRSGRPRWRIDHVDLMAFESQRAAIPDKPQPRRRRSEPEGIIKFF